MKTKIHLRFSKLNYSCFFLIGLLVLFGCQKTKKKEHEYTEIELQKALILDHSSWDSLELLVPQIGCQSCINLLIKEYKQSKVQTKLSMIAVGQEKDLRLNYGNDFIDNPNVKLLSELNHKKVGEDCYGLPSLLLYFEDRVWYSCFKTDDVHSVISYLSDHE